MNNFTENNNNQVTITGKVSTTFEFNHEVYGEKFYRIMVSVNRRSEAADTIPCLVSEKMIDVNLDLTGNAVTIVGQFRSKNMDRHSVLYVFADGIITNISDVEETNQIALTGYICKQPIYRRTPLGREIADVLLAVNRAYCKSDYVPCICWGRNANFAGNMEVGEKVRLTGRIQSRIYRKSIGVDEEGSTIFESRIAYEVSVGTIEVLEVDTDEK